VDGAAASSGSNRNLLANAAAGGSSRNLAASAAPGAAGAAPAWRVRAAASFLKSTEFAYEGYKALPMPRAWEMIAMVRKSVFMGLSTSFLILQTPSMQIVATMALLCLSLVLHASVMPYESTLVNVLEGFALLGELFFTFGVMTRVGVGTVTVSALAAATTDADREA
jgi:hypothetical protein